MKNFTILASVLALAACSTGGGGVTAGGPAGAMYDTTGGVSETARMANKTITGMTSAANTDAEVYEYLSNALAESGTPAMASVGGAAAHAASGRQTEYSQNKLDEMLEIRDLAEWLVDETTTHDDIVAQFNSDKAKVRDALKLLKDSWCYVGGSAEETANRILARRANGRVDGEDVGTFDEPLKDLVNNTHTFHLDNVIFKSEGRDASEEDIKFNKISFLVNSDGKIIGVKSWGYTDYVAELQPDDKTFAGKFKFYDDYDHSDTDEPEVTGDVKFQFKTFGADVGLKYSDFGQFIDGDDDAGSPFAGGYESKRIEPKATDAKMHFAGRAVGNFSVYGYDEEAYVPGKALDGDVELAFDGGSETITASFSDWYDVIVDKKANSHKMDLTFKDKLNEQGESVVDKDYRFSASGDYSSKDYENAGFDSGKSTFVEYFGDDGDPIEAVGIVRYLEGDNDYQWKKLYDEGLVTSDHNVDGQRVWTTFQMNFGVKRD